MKAEPKKTVSWICALLVLALMTLAYPQRAAADNDDPPGRVARLNYLRGSVSFQPAGESDWVPAARNRPMTTGDRLWVDNGARAEMHRDHGWHRGWERHHDKVVIVKHGRRGY